jgi:hypothetical protein
MESVESTEWNMALIRYVYVGLFEKQNKYKKIAYRKKHREEEILASICPASGHSLPLFHQPIPGYHHQSAIQVQIVHFANHLRR